MKLVPLGICLVLLSLFMACTLPSGEVVSSPIEVTDQLGRIVRLDKIPQRIVSLAPSNTELLFALGLGDRVVGVTDYCNYPPEVQGKPSVGGFSTPDLERIIALSPDLILADSIHEKDTIPELEQRGLTVLALAPKTIDEVIGAINIIGEAAGNEPEASELIADLEARIEAVASKTASLSPDDERPRVLFVIWHDPLWTAGSETLINEIIEKAGGVNLARELSGHQVINLEVVVEENPEVIIAITGHGDARDLPLEWAQTETRLENTSARQGGRVYQIDADVATHSGPRIVTALEQFAEFIHPELFKEG